MDTASLRSTTTRFSFKSLNPFRLRGGCSCTAGAVLDDPPPVLHLGSDTILESSDTRLISLQKHQERHIREAGQHLPTFREADERELEELHDLERRRAEGKRAASHERDREEERDVERDGMVERWLVEGGMSGRGGDEGAANEREDMLERGDSRKAEGGMKTGSQGEDIGGHQARQNAERTNRR
ncbi:hypothetical protein P7C73_g6018, partial [Tremellales sp. Uapishka_1]